MLSLSKRRFTFFRPARERLIGTLAGSGRVIALGTLICFAACDDMRPPIVWDGQTNRAERNVVTCLERSGAFASVSGVHTGTAVTVGTETRSYLIAEGVLLQFDRASSDIDRLFVRSDRPLTNVEKAGLSECAPYPAFPL